MSIAVKKCFYIANIYTSNIIYNVMIDSLCVDVVVYRRSYNYVC